MICFTLWTRILFLLLSETTERTWSSSSVMFGENQKYSHASSYNELAIPIDGCTYESNVEKSINSILS